MRKRQPSFRSGLATTLAVSVLSACAVLPRQPLGPPQQQLLANSLKVSVAALETGQPVATGRLYEQLSDTFLSVPEPKLGLAHFEL